MTELFLIVISTVFVNNLLLEMAIGTDPAMNFSKRSDMAQGFSMALIFLLPLTTTLGYCLDQFLLQPYQLGFARLVLFAVLILFAMSLLKPFLPRIKKEWQESISIYYPIVGLNTIALATILLSLKYSHSVLQSFVYGLGSALAIALVMLLFTAMRQRLETCDIPAPFKGIPINLISLGMLSMGFLGFAALVKV